MVCLQCECYLRFVYIEFEFKNIFLWIIYSLYGGRQTIFSTLSSTKFGMNLQVKGSYYFPAKIQKFEYFHQKCFKSTSSVRKDLPEVKPSESNEQLCQNSKFQIMDYIPCPCKSLFRLVFKHNIFIRYLLPKNFDSYLRQTKCLVWARKTFYFIINKIENNQGKFILRGKPQQISMSDSARSVSCVNDAIRSLSRVTDS